MENQLVALVVGLAALWMVMVGLTMMVRGPEAAGRVLAWPFQMGFRFVRWAIGSTFVAIGNAILGGGNRRGGQRRRH